MLIVREVYPDGHEGLEDEHLEYLRSMANRVGFSVVGDEPGTLPAVVTIQLHVAMTNPVFDALVECA